MALIPLARNLLALSVDLVVAEISSSGCPEAIRPSITADPMDPVPKKQTLSFSMLKSYEAQSQALTNGNPMNTAVFITVWAMTSGATRPVFMKMYAKTRPMMKLPRKALKPW
jgi:hypothetical protein